MKRAIQLVTTALCLLAMGLAIGGMEASAASPQISLSVNSGAPGATLTISGTGFPPNEIVALYVDAPGTYLGQPGPRSDSQGNFSLGASIPGAVSPGPHQICGDTGYPGGNQAVAAKACTQFTVLRGASPSASSSPTNSPSGSPGGPSVRSVAVVLAILVLIALGVGYLMRRTR